jgi:hypothetical protein
MRELESRIISEQSFYSSCCWGFVLDRLLEDIEQITDGPETFYASQKKFLRGRTIELNTIRKWFPLSDGLQPLNLVLLIVFMLILTYVYEHSRYSYVLYIVFGLWLVVFGICIFIIFYTFLLPVLYSINDFHLIPCLWKDYDHATVVSLELMYNLQQESACDLYFIIDGKRVVLNFTLRNELKRKKILKIIAINDKYFRSFFIGSVALLTFVFSQFLAVNPFTAHILFIVLAPTAVPMMLLVYWLVTVPLISLLDCCRHYFRWTGPMENKIRSLVLDEEAPMVRV